MPDNNDNIDNMIRSYRIQGFTLHAEGTTDIDGAHWRTMFFHSPTAGRILVFVSPGGLYQEYQATLNSGEIAKHFLP